MIYTHILLQYMQYHMCRYWWEVRTSASSVQKSDKNIFKNILPLHQASTQVCKVNGCGATATACGAWWRNPWHHQGHLVEGEGPLGHGVLPCFFVANRYVMFFPLKVTYTLLIITGGLESFQYPLFLTASMNRHVVKPIHGAYAWHLARFSRGITTLHPDFGWAELSSAISTLPKTDIAPENGPAAQKESIVFQPSIFRFYVLLLSGRVAGSYKCVYRYF